MQDIIVQIRQKLGSYLGGAPALPFSLPEPDFRPSSAPAQHFSRFVRKLPKQNYQELARLVPISWL